LIQNFDASIANYYDPDDRQRGYIIQRNTEGVLTHYPVMGVSVAILDNEGVTIRSMSQVSEIAGRLKQYMKGLEGSCYVKHRLDAGKNGSPVEVHFPTQAKTLQVLTVNAQAQKYFNLFNSIITEKKIQSYYQPIVDMKTRQVVGYEALTRGVSGSSFDDVALLFSVARESGRVKELDKLCVEYALKSGQALEKDQKLFLNLNHETLIDPKIMKELFVDKGVIGFKNIVIEVTEQSILRSFDKVREALIELKEQGVSVAIDDVGGGAVSLRDVAILKPDYMKFDRSLIRQIDSNITKQQIVLSLKLFANGIQAKTTAEGIETKDEYEAVLLCGIDLAQGYYFARPGKPFPKVTV
jgi:EAL domain-containing protein (putative c-di-GMP-specific phosphodiesterase class I)